MTREPNEFENNSEDINVNPAEERELSIADLDINTTEELEKKLPKAEKPEPETKGGKVYKVKSTYNEEEYEDFIYTKYYGKRRSPLSLSSNHNNTSYSSRNNFVKSSHHSKKRHRHRKWWEKLLIYLGWILAGLVALVAIALVAFFILKNSGVSQLTGGEVEIAAPVIESADVSVDNSNKTINYNGKTYVYNNNMTSILCMGVDKRGGLGMEEGEFVGKGGQADALFLVALDTQTGKTNIIAISRDIYSDISVYSADGVYTGTENAQLCLAYAYGDGKETSCENTVMAVERLFYNLPINSYFAMDVYAIGELNDAVKGVYVTLEDDYMYNGMGFYGRAGDTVRLYGDYARAYLQYRDVSQLNSSVDRMNRQINYIERFTQRAIERTKNDFSVPLDLYNIVKDNSVTNLNVSKISALAYTVVNSEREVEFNKVPGEVIHNGEYAEYIVDEQGLFELILDVYYEPVN